MNQYRAVCKIICLVALSPGTVGNCGFRVVYIITQRKSYKHNISVILSTVEGICKVVYLYVKKVY